MGRTHQQAEVLPWSQVGVAKVAGSLEDSDDALHVTGEAEAVVGHDQQLYDCKRRSSHRVSTLGWHIGLAYWVSMLG